MAEGWATRARRALLAPLIHAHRAHIERRHAARLARDYTRWVQAHDRPSAATLQALVARAAAAGPAPLLVWLVDAQGADPGQVRATVQSLQDQAGPAGTVVLAGTAQAAHEAPGAAALAWPEPAREAWARALAAWPDAWIGMLNAGTVVPPHATALLAEALLAHPQALAAYADHDHLDAQGRRVLPHFKCDWNPELMLGHAYLLPLALVRARHAAPLPAQPTPHARWLVFTRGLSAAQVLHVPHVLAHLPLVRGLAPVQADAGAVQGHLSMLGLRCDSVEQHAWGCRPRLQAAAPAPRVSVIVPTRDKLELLAPCVQGVLACTQPAVHELLIVDNGSVAPATLAFLRGSAAVDPRVRVLRDERPFNYSALNNAAAQQATGDWLLLLNNDTEPARADWLAELLGAASLPGVAAVGARLWYADGTLQHAGLLLGLEGVAGDAHRRLTRRMPGHQGRAQLIQGLSAVTAACLLVRRDIFMALGGLDEAHLAVAYNDVDLCLRLVQAGHRVVWTPSAELYHHESRSRGADTQGERAARFGREADWMRQRWGPLLTRDPAYNPNLALTGGAFKLAWPPRVSLQSPWFEAGAAGAQNA